MLFEDTIAEYEHLIRSFEEAQKRQDLKELNVLIEYIRAEGLFYADYHQHQLALVNLIFAISHELLKNPAAQNSDELWWFIRQFYDVLFHQVRLTDYPVTSTKHYEELTNEIKEFHFENPTKESAVSVYNDCIYFVELMQ